ncbi:hypothetical protein MMYC01_204481 [Madurella mycetomatis]|uniref:Uncharacterized protein n=1 Tax=Madurella mycetomatis TaxID=100816 RepID=A0A175W771_9PEZI|nr:hypothetical protein MMYC01_205302 [Madurella mycetomatis]KXX79556.1 hypothetical protein MMYC01_204481 [Madurella mycetomatis]
MQLKYLVLCLVSAAAALPVAENPMPAPPADVAPLDHHATRRDNSMPAPPVDDDDVTTLDNHMPRKRDNHTPVAPPDNSMPVAPFDQHVPRDNAIRDNHAPVAPPDNSMPVAPFDQHVPRDNAIRDNQMPSPVN